MITSTITISAVLIGLAVLSWPRLAGATFWRAAVTPLASIVGSGFLVLGPILDASYGKFAPLVMLLLCALAYAFGSAIRYNMRTIANLPDGQSVEPKLESIASWVLAFAYIISVAYYLNLFGAFAVSLTPANDAFHSKLVTSAVLLVILFTGWTWGFSAMERLEQISVSIKLSIILGLIAGLAIYFSEKLTSGELHFDPPSLSGWSAITLAFGLLVTVQGFETSRYLGNTYDAETRIKSMKLAQLISTIIYLVYVVLLTYSFDSRTIDTSETAIIDMMSVITPILPLLMVAAALSAQFSAAVADTGGAGGLFHELSGNRVSARHAYVLLSLICLVLTWTINIFEIIALASRAFAIYYSLQALIAARVALQQECTRSRGIAFSALAAVGIAIALFGVSVE